MAYLGNRLSTVSVTDDKTLVATAAESFEELVAEVPVPVEA